ncbi:hypothetical protein J4460_05710 [Candidatus Woesearchaeota archaeon]|nr:MAG: hypothetical protein QS99_C0016G0036 [archaeon GW2011_AR4]MBS3130143.1 hypothetical protein [Candidatus Woesearchaeota archaeon]HIH38974.1 hypothetical protein [Candidatus Woesearchaeota archaeon]HIH49001.1 hypothetical protein [Candidatus Woesearchaeota archaeon]HIJ04108.1 hypothetical protein [Candidatus Woesearchaeota archaeon]
MLTNIVNDEIQRQFCINCHGSLDAVKFTATIHAGRQYLIADCPTCGYEARLKDDEIHGKGTENSFNAKRMNGDGKIMALDSPLHTMLHTK